MKKIIVLLMVILCVMAVHTVNTEDVVRIHIRANSDSAEDQEIKLLVRDKVNEFLAPLLESPENKEEAVAVLHKHSGEIEAIAEAVSGAECSVRVSDESFPKKTYGGKVYPAGEYTALILEIGSGEGRNWWCVAYPNMCFTSSEKKVEYRSIIVELLERIGIL